MSKATILVVEDDPSVRNLITTTLKMYGYGFLTAGNGQSAIMQAASHNPDVIFLDLGLPDMDGVDVIRRVREWSELPIIVISARSEETDKIEALDAGADDYLTKPFAMGELLARIRSLTRRSESYTPKQLHLGDVTLNTDEQELSSHNSIRLAGKETKMMEFFMLNAGKELTTQELLDHIWSDNTDKDPEIVWVYVCYLRNKLQAIRADIEIAGEHGGTYVLRQFR